MYETTNSLNKVYVLTKTLQPENHYSYILKSAYQLVEIRLQQCYGFNTPTQRNIFYSIATTQHKFLLG